MITVSPWCTLLYPAPAMAREWPAIRYGADSLLVADPEVYPHLLVAGANSQAKPAWGYGCSGLDFLSFLKQPNSYAIMLEVPSDHLPLLCEAI